MGQYLIITFGVASGLVLGTGAIIALACNKDFTTWYFKKVMSGILDENKEL